MNTQNIHPFLKKLLNGATVEWKPLGEVCKTITTGKLNANAMNEGGKYPFFTCNITPYAIDEYAFDTEAILISGNGSQVGHINYYNGKFNAYQRTYVLSDFANVNTFFLLHFLKCYLKNYIMLNAKVGSIPYITLPMLKEFQIPIPPLAVQSELVKILDKFTELTAELSVELATELTARKKQYAYYRDKLLTFADDAVEWKALGEVAKLIRGKGLSKKDIGTGQMPIILYGELYTTYGNKIFSNDIVSFCDESRITNQPQIQQNDILLPVSSTTKDANIGTISVYLDNKIVFLGGDAVIFRPDKSINSVFLMYCLNSNLMQKDKMRCVKGTTINHLDPQKFAKLQIPIPPLAEQERIANILDKFDTLTNSISEGIPREIELRKKQYEYYRDKLLTFPKATKQEKVNGA